MGLMKNLGAALLALSMSCALLLLSATPASAAPGVAISTLAGDRYTPGEPVALVVEITATKATRGSIIVRIEGRETARQEFEIAGGATKQLIVVTETLQWGGNLVVAVDSDDGDEIYRPRLVEDREAELVGLLPNLSSVGLPNNAPAATGGRTARIHPIPELAFQADARALDMFDTIAGSADDFAALSPSASDAMRAWTARGGSLLIDAGAGTEVAGLNLVSSQANQPYGLGNVRFTDGDLRRGNVDGMFGATMGVRIEEFGQQIDPGALGRTLVNDAGISVPGISALMGLIGLYILVVGPILFLGLRRTERQPFTWIAIPGLAFFAVAAVWVVGQAQRSNIDLAHATIVADIDGLRIERSNVLVASANGGFVGLSTTDGFRAASSPNHHFGEFGLGEQQITNANSLGVDLNPGEASQITVERISGAPATSTLLINAEITDRSLTGTVTNTSDLILEDVRVVAGNAVQLIGAMAPGETAEFALDERFATVPLAEDSLYTRMNQNFFDPFGERNQDEGAVNAGALAGFVARYPESRSSGRVMALGWSRDPSAPVLTDDGESIDRGRTGFLTLQSIGVNADPAVAYGEAATELLRLWDIELNDRGVNQNDFAEFPSEMLITLPGDADPAGSYVLDLSDEIAGIDIWNGTDWKPASERIVDDLIVLNDDEVTSGQAHIRAGYRGFGRFQVPVLRSATAEELASRS